MRVLPENEMRSWDDVPNFVKGKRYERLVKEFVTERLYEEEERAGLVGQAQCKAVAGSPSPTGGS